MDQEPGAASKPGKAPDLFFEYGVAPVALVVVLAFRHFGVVAQVPVWAYAVAILGSLALSQIVEPWTDAGPGTCRMHVRIAVHVTGVTAVIYLSGWGGALGMAYAFAALADLERSGAATWRAALGWSLLGCGVGQTLVFVGWAPSLFTRSHAEAIGILGAFVFGIAIRMAGATGEYKERAEAMLAQQAWHDALTGLPNRQLLVDRLTRAIAMLDRREGEAPAVMFLDLDRFKLVNDTLGHHAGDVLLVQVAERVSAVLRKTDTLARFGGDEFVVLCEETSGADTIEHVAERVRAAFDDPFDLGGECWTISVSIGIALLDGEITNTETLLSEADAAMYFAKAQGVAGKVQIFDEPTRRAARRRVHTETDLAHALAREELLLHYQPIVDVASRHIVGVEALLRWQHPERGLLSPSEFLEPAERTGLIVPIGEWVLATACTTVTRWNRTRPLDEHLHLAVNLSPRQLAEPDLVQRTMAVLSAAGIDPRELRLSFELTENFGAVHETRERDRLMELSTLGVHLAIDDFGTGYSSLGYVKDLPVSVVKIDRTFVEGICERPRDRAIVRGVIELAHSIDLWVVAEGVETEAQYAALVALGCDYAQGFLIGYPEPAEHLFARAAA
jgi:diguanylate cyclase (GGDEF)-like protein